MISPVEQRIAVAMGPSRTTYWTSLRVESASGSLGLLIPVAPGAAIDRSSDAWLEALEAATAPRILPPAGASAVCPGQSPNPSLDPFHVTADLGKSPSIEPTESTLLANSTAVKTWATTHGFAIPSALAAVLDAYPATSFYAERFIAPPGAFVTSTLRVVMPTASQDLQLDLMQAAGSDLRVTTWFVGAGRPVYTGATSIKLHMENLAWNASSYDSNYGALRASELLGAGPSSVLAEASSHDAFVTNAPIAGGKGTITSVITSYFQRAASYLDGDENSAACITSAAVALGSTSPVADSCPRADLGVVFGDPMCTETPTGSQVDPGKLRCGGRADDLAIALSGLEPANTLLTRTTMIVPKGSSGQTWPISFMSVAPNIEPVLSATSIDYGMCGSTSSTSSSGSPWPFGSSSSSSGSSSSGSPTTYEPVYEPDVGCGCVGTAEPLLVDDTSYGGGGSYDSSGGYGGTGGSGGDYYYDDTTSSDDCSGDTTDTTYDDTTYDDTSSSDDCSGDTTDTTDTSSSDDCSGDTTDTTDTTDPTYQDVYYSDSSSDSEGIDCSGDTDDSSSDSSDCTIARHPKAKTHRRGPKASVMMLGLLAILAPLRRMSRPRRSTRGRQDKRQNEA